MKDLEADSYDTSIKKIKDNQRNVKISHTLEFKQLILLKCSQYPKQSTYLMWSLSKLKSLQITNAGKGVERREPYSTVGVNVNWYSHY